MLAHSKIRADLIETCDMSPNTKAHAISALSSVFTLRPAFPYGHNFFQDHLGVHVSSSLVRERGWVSPTQLKVIGLF